ncbi:MAG: MarC family protein [Parvularculales bacterium]
MDIFWTIVLPTFVTLFIVIDPIGMLPVFVSLTQDADAAKKRIVAIRTIVVSVGVLMFFGLLGTPFLKAIGVGLPAFRIAGGTLLFLIAVEMLFGRRTERRKRSVEEAQTEFDYDISVFPLAIPMITGPGAVATILLLMNAQVGDVVAQGVILSIGIVVLLLCYILFRLSDFIQKIIGETISKVISRVSGIILAALATQYVLDGLRAYWLVA